jgi:hypothetical protein
MIIWDFPGLTRHVLNLKHDFPVAKQFLLKFWSSFVWELISNWEAPADSVNFKLSDAS